MIGFGFERRRQKVDDGVEQRLHALVLEGRTAQHRQHAARDRRLAQRRLEALDRDLFAVEEHLEQLVVLLGDRLDQFADATSSRSSRSSPSTSSSVSIVEPSIVGVDDLLHREEVDDALEIVFGADRHLNRNGVRAEALANLVDAR